LDQPKVEISFNACELESLGLTQVFLGLPEANLNGFAVADDLPKDELALALAGCQLLNSTNSETLATLEVVEVQEASPSANGELLNASERAMLEAAGAMLKTKPEWSAFEKKNFERQKVQCLKLVEAAARRAHISTQEACEMLTKSGETEGLREIASLLKNLNKVNALKQKQSTETKWSGALEHHLINYLNPEEQRIHEQLLFERKQAELEEVKVAMTGD